MATRISAARRAQAERYERAAGHADGWAAEGVARVTEAFRADQIDTLYLDAQ